MSEHTKGPWCADFGPTGHEYIYILAGETPQDNAPIVASVRNGTAVGPTKDAACANARLLAAAPALLAALEDCTEHIEAMMAHIEHKPERFKSHCLDKAIKARKVIGKAKGHKAL